MCVLSSCITPLNMYLTTMYYCILVYNFFEKSPPSALVVRCGCLSALFACVVPVNFSGRQSPQTKIISQWFDNPGGVYINSTAAVVTPVNISKNKKSMYYTPHKYSRKQKEIYITSSNVINYVSLAKKRF